MKNKLYYAIIAACLLTACASEKDVIDNGIECGNTVCRYGFQCCNGTCVDLENSFDHCGSCNNRCPEMNVLNMHVLQSGCAQSACVFTCIAGYEDRDKIAANGCETYTKSVCGNHVLEGDEICDSEQLNGWTCSLQMGVEAVGVPRCNSTCTGFELGTCAVDERPVCGNEKLDPDEPCDGERLNGNTCETIVGTGSTGRLQCLADCSGFDVSLCTSVGGKICGNGLIEAGETCDASNMNGQTCASVAGAGFTGNLLCKSDCSGFDISGCTKGSVGRCGNGLIEAGETCDASNMNGQTCATVAGAGFTGNLLCKSDCSGFDKTGCKKTAVCTEGDVRCDGLSLQMCDESGQWLEIEACDTSCDEASQSCGSACTNVNDAKCDGKKLMFCKAKKQWELLETCKENQTCDAEKAECVDSCKYDARRCEGNNLFVCRDDEMSEDKVVCDTFCVDGAGCALCTNASECISEKCNASTFQCEPARTAKYYFTDFDWVKSMTTNKTKNVYTAEYIQPDTTGYVMTVHARTNVLTEEIDGQAVMINRDSNSYIEISKISSGVNMVIFDLVGYDEKTVVTITAGMTLTAEVAKDEIKSVMFTFNNNADRIFIRADNRVTIDNFGWSTMK